MELIHKEFLVSIPHPKGGGIVCICVENNVINKNEDFKAIGLHGFDYKIFEEGEVQEGLYRYSYLKHIIKLWQGYLVE